MSLGGALLWVLMLCAGGAVVGLVRADLELWERLALAAVSGVLLSAAATLGVSLVLGTSGTTVVLGPALLTVVAVAAGSLRSGPSPAEVWASSWARTRALVRARSREPWTVLGITAVAAAGFAWLFAHTLYTRDGAIVAGYPTVWADWSLHATLASSFAVAHNLPPTDPIFSGTRLTYPFLPDYHAAMLLTAGDSVGAALATPGVVLCTSITVLVVSLARRLCGSAAVGAIALLLVVGGGSLGFTGVWWDACRAAGHTDAECTLAQSIVHPRAVLDVAGRIPGVVASPPRPYDNLQAPTGAEVGNVQWYTPLLAWWLPQRTFLYGFATGLAVLLLVVVGRRAPPGTRSPWLLGGALVGLLPLVHVHTLFALGIVLPLLALVWRRREWLWLAGPAALLALPRLLQVAASGHGVAATCADGSTAGGGTGTLFPFLEPGWMAHSADAALPTAAFDPNGCYAQGRYSVSPGGILHAVPAVLRTLVDPTWWGFWLMNNGVVAIVGAAAAAYAGLLLVRRLSSRPVLSGVVERVQGVLPDDLLVFCLPFVAIFAVANVVVFQTWDWDNTKLLAWWYLGGALLTAALLMRLLRGGVLRAVGGVLVLVTLVAGAALSLVRYARDPNIPYTWASAADRALAAAVAARTPVDSVFLTAGNPTDPVLTLAGRTAVVGYAGWLYSYGIDTGSRTQDVQTMLAGCGADLTTCAVPRLLASYHVDFVEVCRDAAQAACSGDRWYASRYPVVAASPALTVYDVRNP